MGRPSGSLFLLMSVCENAVEEEEASARGEGS